MHMQSETWFFVRVERHHFAVDYGVIRQRRQSLHEYGVARVKVVVVAGAQMNLPLCLIAIAR